MHGTVSSWHGAGVSAPADFFYLIKVHSVGRSRLVHFLFLRALIFAEVCGGRTIGN